MEVNQILDKGRTKNGLSFNEAAKVSGVSKRTLQLIKSNQANLKLDTIKKLMAAYGIKKIEISCKTN